MYRDQAAPDNRVLRQGQERARLNKQWDVHEHIFGLAMLAFYMAGASHPDNQDWANTKALNLATDPEEYQRWDKLCQMITNGQITALWQAVKELETPKEAL